MFADENGCTCYDETTRRCPVHAGSGNVVPIRQTDIREFATGATRTIEGGKFDYEGFLSPLALERYGEYMHSHRKLPDGSMRDSDNWQRGIPMSAYMKSMWRHFFDAWKIHRGGCAHDPLTGHELTMEDALCAVMFNAMGFLHEHLKSRLRQPGQVA